MVVVEVNQCNGMYVIMSVIMLLNIYNAVDCVWKDWDQWSTCTVTCGGGKQYRSRGQIAARHNGAPCVGDSEQERNCNTNPCPGECLSLHASYNLC